MKGIALCGFMGCGKTTVATALSEKYGLCHIDTDKFIEEENNTTISQMFSEFSESYFRDKEFEAICRLSKESGKVLALGGGAVMFERNVNALKENGYTLIFIDTDFEVIKSRLINDTTRPLLKTNDISELYKKRYPVYESACDLKVHCKNETGEQIADIIFNSMQKKA